MPRTFIATEKVAASLTLLRDQWIHPHFAAYLCLKRTAARDGRSTNLSPDFKEFFETFLRVPGASKEKPYLRPFLDEAASDTNVWLNRNLAGSFAPSSLRQTLPKVISVSGGRKGARYSFRPRHWKLGQTHLLRGKSVPIVELVAVLYRDYALISEDPSLADWVTVFREEFGYPPPPPGGSDDEFRTLYYDESSKAGAEWLERVP